MSIQAMQRSIPIITSNVIILSTSIGSLVNPDSKVLTKHTCFFLNPSFENISWYGMLMVLLLFTDILLTRVPLIVIFTVRASRCLGSWGNSSSVKVIGSFLAPFSQGHSVLLLCIAFYLIAFIIAFSILLLSLPLNMTLMLGRPWFPRLSFLLVDINPLLCYVLF